jgi:hypothetical protein
MRVTDGLPKDRARSSCHVKFASESRGRQAAREASALLDGFRMSYPTGEAIRVWLTAPITGKPRGVKGDIFVPPKRKVRTPAAVISQRSRRRW